ncbi:MAG TPA: SH3 domain-containing protein [Thermoanaerobaculia bacterium]|nr:SH3 domain-containing protein [Thermoanaerobaculia bacterium]
MRSALLVTLLLSAACSQPAPDTTDMRQPMAILYVGGENAPVHSRPDDNAPVITKFEHSESVPVMSKQGDWAEVRTALGDGWVHQSDLVGADEGASSRDNPNPKFEHPPSPISSPGTHGTIYIRADVNTDGVVTSTQLISNTTGSDALAAENAAALQRAKFYPIIIRGERKPFQYFYRVDY